ncbi:hypothetical protein Bhyg_13716 [Pseudolycoriella hygida]|uniref:Chitin-binding type-4 domain-containing protein n=1 Tax=Pseudolycoriella hygida TaxID=35572 RepID=A0A9Q0MNE3_9DIPT|nr:hypothetical protein Bhyg_13716 [Pseudolycoriella hygida]
MNKFYLLMFISVTVTYVYVAGHGMVLDPVNRASRWRYDTKAKADYDDSQGWCGGFYTQYTLNGGECGLCGDDYSKPTPRAHEFGGTYGQGVIVKSYQKGGQLPVSVMITANHLGYFYFRICNMDVLKESKECFEANRIKLTNGADTYPLPSDLTGWFNTTLQLPPGLTCNHCVLQWTYNVGNSWGVCPDGRGAMGCGNQENFRTCSDIRIL